MDEFRYSGDGLKGLTFNELAGLIASQQVEIRAERARSATFETMARSLANKESGIHDEDVADRIILAVRKIIERGERRQLKVLTQLPDVQSPPRCSSCDKFDPVTGYCMELRRVMSAEAFCSEHKAVFR